MCMNANLDKLLEELLEEEDELEEQVALAGGGVGGFSGPLGGAGFSPAGDRGKHSLEEVNSMAMFNGMFDMDGYTTGDHSAYSDQAGDYSEDSSQTKEKDKKKKKHSKKKTHHSKVVSDILWNYGNKPCGSIPRMKYTALEEQIAVTITPAPKVKRTLKVVCDKELNPTSLQTVVDFIKFSNGVLKIETLPVIHLHTIKKPDMTTGAYDRNTNHIHALVGKRLIVDVLRTLAHELTHRRQDETGSLDAQLANADHMDEMGDINTGYENEAYTLAGNLVKIFCRKYPNDKRISKEQLYQLQENKKF